MLELGGRCFNLHIWTACDSDCSIFWSATVDLSECFFAGFKELGLGWAGVELISVLLAVSVDRRPETFTYFDSGANVSEGFVSAMQTSGDDRTGLGRSGLYQLEHLRYNEKRTSKGRSRVAPL